jgi:hypothetical protein
MGVSGQHHAQAALYPLGKDPRYPLYSRLGGPQNRSGHRLEEKSFAPAGDRTPIVQPVVRHYTAWAKPAPHSLPLQTQIRAESLAQEDRRSCGSHYVRHQDDSSPWRWRQYVRLESQSISAIVLALYPRRLSVIFILASMRTWNLANESSYYPHNYVWDCPLPDIYLHVYTRRFRRRLYSRI